MTQATPFPQIVEALLAWYDEAARALPWRIGPAERKKGRRPDPYHVWLSEVMLQQTTVAVVKRYYERFLTLWPTIEALAQAALERVLAEWAGLGYYARARNLLATARAVAARGGFPQTAKELQKLPGIGRYTAAAIAAIAFDQPEPVVDGNVERVLARIFAVSEPLPAAKPKLARLAEGLTPPHRPGCFAQAMMDLGATVCTPRAPRCNLCPLAEFCQARALGCAAELPRRARALQKPLKHGIAYVARRSDGLVLLEERPAKGLLGGLRAFPCTDFVADAPAPNPPLAANWHQLSPPVRHVFTHFRLELAVMVAEVGPDARAERGFFAPVEPNALPSLMAKVWRLATSALAKEGGLPPQPQRKARQGS